MSMTDPARSRYIALMALRIAATTLIVFGMILAFGNKPWLDPQTSRITGYGMMAVGFVDLLVIIPMMIRRWRSPTK